MKWSYAALGVIVLGIIGVSIIILFQELTTSNENDYYLLKEATEAAMLEAIDISYYRETGELKIVREKFVENFSRRFAESTTYSGTGYTIDFYDIMETPPKVSLVVNTEIKDYKIENNTADYGIQNHLDAILEYVDSNTKKITKGNNPYEKDIKATYTYYYIANTNNVNKISLNIPDELIAGNIKNQKISNVEFSNNSGNDISEGDYYKALISQDIYFKNSNASDFYLKDFSDIKKINDVQSISYCNSEESCKESNKCSCDGISVGDKDNKYWINLNLNNNESPAIIKFNVTWSYDKYKYGEVK